MNYRYRAHVRRNPTSWQTDVRSLLKEMTGDAWLGGSPMPESWTRPFLARRPLWTPLEMISATLDLKQDRLIEQIRPRVLKKAEGLGIEGVRLLVPDAQDRAIFYQYVLEYLDTHGSFKRSTLLKISSDLNLKLKPYVLNWIIKVLLKQKYIKLVAPSAFKGSHYYVATQVFKEWRAKQAPGTKPVVPEISDEELEVLTRPEVPSAPEEDLHFEPVVQETPELPGILEPDAEQKAPKLPRRVKKGVSIGGDPYVRFHDLVRKFGLHIKKGAKHKIIQFPGGGALPIPGTPSDYRSFSNSLADLKRIIRKKISEGLMSDPNDWLKNPCWLRNPYWF